MKFTPHLYQERGVELLSHPGGSALLLDPGMGKTGIAATTFSELQDMPHGFEKLRMLVIVPIQPMYGTWPDECAKWDHLRHLKLSIIHGSVKQREKALAADADIYLINPEGIQWLYDESRLEQHPIWQILCVDESTKFKKTTTARFKKVKPYLYKFVWRWIMTGTIAPNGLKDLFGQVYIMDRGEALGEYVTHFLQTYFMQVPNNKYTWVPMMGATERVISKLDVRALQLRAEDHLDMPDMIKVERAVPIVSERVMEIYREVEEEFISEVQSEAAQYEDPSKVILAANSGAASIKLRQIANGAVYAADQSVLTLHDAKLTALEDICEETNGHPLLIMYEFKHDRDRIQKMLGADCVCVTGLSGTELTNITTAFNNGEIRYLLMHPGSVHGMNIQKHCHHIVWFSIIWNLEFYIQANTRLYRQGQTSQTVMCYHLVAQKTVDRSIMRALATKGVTQADIEEQLRRFCGVS